MSNEWIKFDDCISPPSQFYSRKPVIVLSSHSRQQRGRDTEAGCTQSEFHDTDDLLDKHVESVLTRQDKVKRTLQGVWSFLKTRQCNRTRLHRNVCSLCIFAATGVSSWYITSIDLAHIPLDSFLQFIMGIYGFLVGKECLTCSIIGCWPFTVFWGAALVLFLLKWINLHNANTQGFWVEVCSQIECGL